MKFFQRAAPILIAFLIYVGSYGILRSGLIIDSGLLRIGQGTGNPSSTSRIIYVPPGIPEQVTHWENRIYYPCRKADEQLTGIGVSFYQPAYVF